MARSDLRPFTAEERFRLATLALRFFSPAFYEENLDRLGREKTPGRVSPFSLADFCNYL